MIEEWINEIKKSCNPEMLGMILTHNGVVRGTAKDGKRVGAMHLTCNRELLADTIAAFKGRPGIVDIRAWINEGDLRIGDDIMKVCVAGRFRTDVLPVFQELLTILKQQVVAETEL